MILHLCYASRIFFQIIVIGLAIVLVLTASEILLRLAGCRPWKVLPTPNMPALTEPDLSLEWHNKPGTHIFPGFTDGADLIHITIESDGLRRTEPGPSFSKRDIVALLGDSFTFGWAISDEETFAWKLQKRFPSLAFRNYGVGAYGTLQSLLQLRLLAENPSFHPRLILYGFNDFHEQRNVAAFAWLDLLTRASKKKYVVVPYATIDTKEQLHFHPPDHYRVWPLASTLASVNIAGKWLAKLQRWERTWKRRLVTEKLLKALQSESTKIKGAFAVLLLSASSEAKNHYTRFCRQEGISLLDCTSPLSDLPEMKVTGEGHPNGRMNSIWADCIARGFAAQWPNIAFTPPSLLHTPALR